MAKKKPAKIKRKSGPINWEDPNNLMPMHVVVKVWPFYGPVLAKMYNMSTGMVYYRLKQHGISLRDIHRGQQGRGVEVVKQYTVKNCSGTVIRQAKDTHDKLFKTKK